MNAFKITFSNGDTLTTNANGTLEEFTAYLMQWGGRTVDENPATGQETVKYIETVEQL